MLSESKIHLALHMHVIDNRKIKLNIKKLP